MKRIPVVDIEIMYAIHPYRIAFGILGMALALPPLLGCEPSSPPPTDAGITQSLTEPSHEAQFEATVRHLSLPGGADYLLVDDFDRDGRFDLALTSHGANVSRLFLQRDGRQWQAGPLITAVGFHPGELIRVPVTAGTEAVSYTHLGSS